LSITDDKLDLFNSKDLENNVDDSIGNKDIGNETVEAIEEEIQYKHAPKNIDDLAEYNDKLITSQDIKFVLATLSKQAPYDKTQIKQIFYGICSSQTSIKIHHNINSKKSGEGKSYLLKIVSDLFPDSFILKFNNMSDKALYHLNGIEAVKNEDTGKYEELKPILKQLESEIDEIEEKIGETNDKQSKRSLKSQIKDIEEEITHLKSKAVKIIDLDDIAFIFLDTPNESLFNNLMSVLSQDTKEQLYIFTDKDNSGRRLQSRTVVLRGSPLIMSTQVIDDTRNYRFAEKNRRFINVNPNTTENKIGEAMRQMAIKLGGPSDEFERIVSSKDIRKSKEIIAKLCKKLKDHNQKFLYNGIRDNGVKIPYASILNSSLPTSDAWSMTVLTRLLNYISIITKVNMDSRPKIVDTETGVSYPISIYEDLKETLKIMETASLSIRPYQQDWLTNVFLPAFEELNPEPNCKTNYHGDIIEKESVVGLTTKQIADKMNKQGANVSITQIYENYLRPLIKQGVINSTRSVLNGKENLYYPVNADDADVLLSSIFPITEDCRLILNKPFEEKRVLEESFRTLLERRSKEGDGNSKKYKIIDIDGSEISVDNLLEKYFFSTEHPTSCSVVLQKYHNDSIEHYSIIGEQTKDDSNQVKDTTDKEDDVNHDCDKNMSINSSYLYECYYCNEFAPTDNRDAYEKHVVLFHDGKLAYPSLADLEKNNLKPKGKYWEI
jgi:hypothetical protein